MSGPRMGMGMSQHINGNSRRSPNIARINSNEKPVHAQHDDLIKYIYDSWMKVEMDSRGSSPAMYYQDEVTHRLRDFQPFDLEGYWGRRKHQMNAVKHQQS